MLGSRSNSEEFKNFDFASIRKKFDIPSQPKQPFITKNNEPKRPAAFNNSLEVLNTSNEFQDLWSSSTDGSERTVLELDRNDNNINTDTCHLECEKDFSFINNSKYILKSSSVSNLLSNKNADFLKLSISIANNSMKDISDSNNKDDNFNNESPTSNLDNDPNTSIEFSKSDSENQNFELIQEDNNYQIPLNYNPISNSDNNKNVGYIQPTNNSSPEEFSFPFPFPTDGFIKSRTDILTEDTFDNVALESEPQSLHSYTNNEDSLMDSNTKAKLYLMLQDIIKKEQDFVEVYRFFYEEYYLTLIDSNFITLSQKQKIFTKTDEIFAFHVTNWLPALIRKSSDWNETNQPKICDIFNNYMNKISFYKCYLSNFQESMQQLDFLYSTKPLFKIQIDRIDQKVRPAFLKLASKMKFDTPTLPIIKSFMFYLQKWPIFVNDFLKEYETYLTVKHPDFFDFDVTRKYLDELSAESSETIEHLKYLEILKELQGRLGNKFNILNRKRVLLKEGPLITLSPHLGTIIKVYIVLFNDLLIICDQAENEFDQLKPKRPLDVIGMLVSNDISAFTDDKIHIKFPGVSKKSCVNRSKGFSINVPCVQKVFKFYARNVQEKNKWYNAFKTVAQANKFERDIDRSNVGMKIPKFIPEKLTQYCCKCRSEFTTFNKKHHCKACGYIFCKFCTKMQANLDYEPDKKNKVCDFCYDHIYKTFRSKPPSIDQVNQNMRQNLLIKS